MKEFGYYKDLLRDRSAWMGAAMIWIVLYHLPSALSFGILEPIRSVGYGGVDVFFFASGIGCFYSLATDADIGRFMKRRIGKLAPCYLIFILFWLLYQFAIGEFSPQMALGNILAVQNFTGLGKDFNWYISALLLFYLLAPYFKLLIDRASARMRFGFLLFLIVLSIPFWNSETYIITVTRLPIFYMGMLFAKLCREERKITRKHVAVMIAAFVLGAAVLFVSRRYLDAYLWSHGLYWYPFILMTPAICIAISCLMRVCGHIKPLRPVASVLSLVGAYSFEVYLIHIPLITIVKYCIRTFAWESVQGVVWFGALLALVIGCRILRRLTNLCVSLIGKKKTARA